MDRPTAPRGVALGHRAAFPHPDDKHDKHVRSPATVQAMGVEDILTAPVTLTLHQLREYNPSSVIDAMRKVAPNSTGSGLGRLPTKRTIHLSRNAGRLLARIQQRLRGAAISLGPRGT